MNWLTIEEISYLMGWTVAYARKRSSLDGWKRRGTKPQQYAAESIIDAAPTR